MNNELNQHKHSDSIKWIATIVAFVMLFSAVAAIGVKAFSTDDPIVVIQKEETANSASNNSGNNASLPTETTAYEIDSVEENGIKLSFGKVLSIPSNASDSGVDFTTQTVTATITPDTVADKYVTWSIAWESGCNLSSENLSEYVQITDNSQGCLTANINCYKAFRGSNIILTCKSRQGDKTATATIMYKGKPSIITLGSAQGASTYNLGNKTVALLTKGNSYTIPITMDNIFHDVGSDFATSCTYSVSGTGIGSFQWADYVKNPRGQGYNIDYSNIPTMNLSSCNMSKFFTASAVGNTLTITATDTYMNYYSEFTESTTNGAPYGTYKNHFYDYVLDSDGNKPYFEITVSNSAYGFSATYQFMITEEVSNIALNSATIEF